MRGRQCVRSGRGWEERVEDREEGEGVAERDRQKRERMRGRRCVRCGMGEGVGGEGRGQRGR